MSALYKQPDKTTSVDSQTDEFIEKVKLLIDHVSKYSFPAYSGEDVISPYYYSTIPSTEIFQRAIYWSLCEDNDRYFMFDPTVHLAIRITREQLEYVISEIFAWYVSYGSNLNDHFIVKHRHKYVNHAISKLREMKLHIIYAHKVTISIQVNHACSMYACPCDSFTLISYNPDTTKLRNNKKWSVNKGWSLPTCIRDSSSHIHMCVYKSVEPVRVDGLYNILFNMLGSDAMIDYVMFVIKNMFDDMRNYGSMILVNDTFIYRLMQHILPYLQYIVLTIDNLNAINTKKKIRDKQDVFNSVIVLHDDIWNTWIKTNKPRRSFLYHIFTSFHKCNRRSSLHYFRSHQFNIDILSISDKVLKQMYNMCGLGINHKMYVMIPCSSKHKYHDIDENVYLDDFTTMIDNTPTNINLHYHVPKPVIDYNNSLT